MKGRYYWNRRTLKDFDTAISYFNQAIAKDPGYALAYAGLADTYTLLPDYGGGNQRENLLKSSAAARKALELDATLAGPHAVLGNNKVEEWCTGELPANQNLVPLPQCNQVKGGLAQIDTNGCDMHR
ncbi:MAG TPA: hypothetical protein VEI52_09805 [Terriglobales bacterium]|nr:hypothetical protein [Terriglobales bacterium]